MPKPIREKVKGLRQRERSDGTWRVWWEPTGAEKKLGLEAVNLDADRPAWSIREAEAQNRAVRRALNGETTKARQQTARTIDALIETYRDHKWYQKRAAGTKRGYKTLLNAISKKWGGYKVSDFDSDVMQAWHDTLADSSGANYATKMTVMMSMLFKLAERLRWRPKGSNPCIGLEREKAKPRSRYASWEEFDALLAAAEDLGMPSLGAAVALSFLQGQRQTDILAARVCEFVQVSMVLPSEDEDFPRKVWVWDFKRSKNDKDGTVPLHDEAVAWVQRMADLRRGADDPLLVDERVGRAYDLDLFQHRWSDLRARAAKACPSLLAAGQVLQFRDLRRSASTWARIGGASHEDVGDLLGNTVADNPVLAATYMPANFYTAARAVSAIRRPGSKERKKA
ncbi:tyrosine-type recombinase/integrase [Roseovarius indicus]|uniref:Site-specific recombinase XerD n=1 Tax=Roseovarius indicus TaxID=540747 RepID=A0A0T5P3Y1_9RHOB|nr:hypothetical protein [Roseovarius indicus]KRS15630.1 hypothetical protein XM52_22580 [Roseovarius indicus]QEW27863.1 Site-specific recombinase XerD [Roseovarius indicus]SFE79033.1 Site-specific recombinase XerD [Roseovarius indicus]